MFSLVLKLILTALLGIFAFHEKFKTFVTDNDKHTFIIYSIIILAIFLISTVLNIFDWKKEIQSNSEIKSLNKIQEHQLGELKLLRDINTAQLKATFYTQELENSINKIFIYIRFNEAHEYSDIHPFSFAVELYSLGNKNIRFKRYIKSDGDVTRGTKDKRILGSSYKIKSLSIEDGKTLGTRNWAPIETTLNGIFIPISLPEYVGIVRDFHDEKFFFYLPEKLIEISYSIELIVNGWQLTQIPLADIKWDEVQIYRMATWSEFEDKELVLYRMYPVPSHLDPSQNPSTLNLYNQIPHRYEKFSSKFNN